jgi:hypothetical protein
MIQGFELNVSKHSPDVCMYSEVSEPGYIF